MTSSVATHLPWEVASTQEQPWPSGWFIAPAGKRFCCVYDGAVIRAGAVLWTTGIEGECYCEAHAPYASSH
jgi:hypothetical protein